MRAASPTIHQLTPRVPQNAGSAKVVVEDRPTGRPHSVVAVIGHWPPADSFRWPPTLEAPRRAEQRLTPWSSDARTPIRGLFGQDMRRGPWRQTMPVRRSDRSRSGSLSHSATFRSRRFPKPLVRQVAGKSWPGPVAEPCAAVILARLEGGGR